MVKLVLRDIVASLSRVKCISFSTKQCLFVHQFVWHWHSLVFTSTVHVHRQGGRMRVCGLTRRISSRSRVLYIYRCVFWLQQNPVIKIPSRVEPVYVTFLEPHTYPTYLLEILMAARARSIHFPRKIPSCLLSSVTRKQSYSFFLFLFFVSSLRF